MRHLDNASARVHPPGITPPGTTPPGTGTTPPARGGRPVNGSTPPDASHSTIPTRRGSARLNHSTPSSRTPCNDGFTATVRGRELKRVVFTLDGKRLANLTRSPFRVHVPATFAGSGHLKARVKSKDATRARTWPCATGHAPQQSCSPGPLHRPSPMIGSGRIARRSLGSRRGTFVVSAAVLSALMFCITSVPQASASGVRVGQALVILLHNKTARTSPSIHAHTVTIVAATRPLTGVRTVLPVLGHATDKHGRTFVDVRLARRPNSSTGWVSTDGTMPSWTPWRLSVSLSDRLLSVYYRGRAVHHFPAVVGKPSTPTPSGSFFIEEGLWMGPGAAGGPYALATSARSDVLTEFDGGPGQVAIHGMDNLPGALGSASSHGCVRLATSSITWLATRIGAGVPLRIRP